VTAASVRDTAGIEPAIAAGSDDGGLAVFPDGFNIENRATTIALAAKHQKSQSRHRAAAPAEMVLRLLVLKHVREGATKPSSIGGDF
jgi:hypothetical protein